MKHLEWFGCYADSWQGEIVPDAFSHPAKFSRALIARIYDHMLANGYIKPGDVIGDPFGGVALGAIHAMLKGLHWRGVELEERFVSLGGQNIALWQARYGELLRGTAVLTQGDSRQFLQHVATVQAFVSSPAYADVINGAGEGPGARFDHVYHNGDNATKKTSAVAYGRTAGNLGNLAAVVSSAPFEESVTIKSSSDEYQRQRMIDRGRNPDARGSGLNEWGGYGDHPANIGNDTGATFWQAAAVIVAQAYAALRPGAYAAWVCGDYVRDGQRVYFGRQWLDLCESVGFVPVEYITAWKTEYKGTQLDIFGNAHNRRIDRVSFFRRLANERNPDAAILNEDVIIVRKEA